MKILTILVVSSFASSALAGSGSSMNSESGIKISSSASSHSWSSTSSGSSSSEASFTAHNSVHKVNGDTVEVKDGDLRVNGISYGKVKETSVVTYSVKGNEKVLTVDGVVRQPAR